MPRPWSDLSRTRSRSREITAPDPTLAKRAGMLDPMTASIANVEQAAFWEGERGAAWVLRADQFDGQLEIYALRVVAAAAPQPGDTVLDIGCGAGATTLAAAQAVGSTGHVVGVDISSTMLDVARRRASSLTFENVELV